MRAIAVPLFVGCALLLTGCASHNVAAVMDVRGGHPKVSGALRHLVRF